eukprot:gene6565-10728_t
MNKTLILVFCLLVCHALAGSTTCVDNSVTATTLENTRSMEMAKMEEANPAFLIKLLKGIFKLFGWSAHNVKQEQETCEACEETKKELGGVHYYCQITCANVDPTVKCPKQNGKQLLLNFDGLFKPTSKLTSAFKQCQQESDKNVNVDNCVCLFLLADNRLPTTESNRLTDAISQECGCNGITTTTTIPKTKSKPISKSLKSTKNTSKSRSSKGKGWFKRHNPKTMYDNFKKEHFLVKKGRKGITTLGGEKTVLEEEVAEII